MANENERRVYMICTDDELAKDVGDVLRRVSSTMSAFDAFSDGLDKVDEDGPNFAAEFAPVLERFLLTVTAIYPNGPGQMQADIKSIGDFTVRTIPYGDKGSDH